MIADRLRRALPGGNAITVALLVYGALNAILYASLMPLWEGFDEPFHYGYVQYLSDRGAIPEFGKTPLSDEVIVSLRAAPSSHVVKRNLPSVITYEDYFRLPLSERLRLQAQLRALPRGYRIADCVNYEAQQAPLAYLLLSPFDRLWRGASLPDRVWRLRLICGLFAAVASVLLLTSLARRLGVSKTLEAALVFVALSGQMFYAAAAHVANDWLAAPLIIACFERAVALWNAPSRKNAVLFTVAVAAGLLTKAYFLALLPLWFCVVAALALKKRITGTAAALSALLLALGAGPWYLRNLIAYKNLSGVQWTDGGTDWGGFASALFQLPWPRAIRDMLFATLWTGNNSYRSFSAGTLGMLLAGFLCAAGVYVAICYRRRTLPVAERWLLFGFALYGVSLVYSATMAFLMSHGEARTATPWQIEAIVPPVLALLFAGLSRWERAGRWIAIWLSVWSAYIIAATYWVKLIPLYLGYSEGRSVFSQIARWYRDELPRVLEEPVHLTLIDPRWILALAAVVAACAVGLAMQIARSALSRRRGGTQT
jgi:hypothetical protein